MNFEFSLLSKDNQIRKYLIYQKLQTEFKSISIPLSPIFATFVVQKKNKDIDLSQLVGQHSYYSLIEKFIDIENEIYRSKGVSLIRYSFEVQNVFSIENALVLDCPKSPYYFAKIGFTPDYLYECNQKCVVYWKIQMISYEEMTRKKKIKLHQEFTTHSFPKKMYSIPKKDTLISEIKSPSFRSNTIKDPKKKEDTFGPFGISLNELLEKRSGLKKHI